MGKDITRCRQIILRHKELIQNGSSKMIRLLSLLDKELEEKGYLSSTCSKELVDLEKEISEIMRDFEFNSQEIRQTAEIVADVRPTLQ